jgi:predicted ester cyclase
MKRLAPMILSVCLIGTALAESIGTEQELKRLETEAWNAVVKLDFKTIDRILADEFIGIYDNDDKANDPIWTKKFLISAVKSGKFVCTSIEYDDLKVRIDGNAAAVSGVTTTKETFDGQDIGGRFRFTSTWIKKPTGWKCVGDRSVRISDTTAKDSATPKTKKNKMVMKRVFDNVVNTKNIDAIDEIYHKDYKCHAPYWEVNGIQEVKTIAMNRQKNFPDYHVSLQNIIAEGDFVACRWISKGTHNEMNKKISFPNQSISRFKDGKIIEEWIIFDSDTPRRQLQD